MSEITGNFSFQKSCQSLTIFLRRAIYYFKETAYQIPLCKEKCGDILVSFFTPWENLCLFKKKKKYNWFITRAAISWFCTSVGTGRNAVIHILSSLERGRRGRLVVIDLAVLLCLLPTFFYFIFKNKQKHKETPPKQTTTNDFLPEMNAFLAVHFVHELSWLRRMALSSALVVYVWPYQC